MTLDLKKLRRAAEAAGGDVEKMADPTRVLREYLQSVSPKNVLELIDQLERAKRELRGAEGVVLDRIGKLLSKRRDDV